MQQARQASDLHQAREVADDVAVALRGVGEVEAGVDFQGLAGSVAAVPRAGTFWAVRAGREILTGGYPVEPCRVRVAGSREVFPGKDPVAVDRLTLGG